MDAGSCLPTFWCSLSIPWGTRWHSCLRHGATSRKVAGSIFDGVVGIFKLHNTSGGTMAQGLTRPLTQMSTRNIFLWIKAAVRRLS